MALAYACPETWSAGSWPPSRLRILQDLETLSPNAMKKLSMIFRTCVVRVFLQALPVASKPKWTEFSPTCVTGYPIGTVLKRHGVDITRINELLTTVR